MRADQPFSHGCARDPVHHGFRAEATAAGAFFRCRAVPRRHRPRRPAELRTLDEARGGHVPSRAWADQRRPRWRPCRVERVNPALVEGQGPVLRTRSAFWNASNPAVFHNLYILNKGSKSPAYRSVYVLDATVHQDADPNYLDGSLATSFEVTKGRAEPVRIPRTSPRRRDGADDQRRDGQGELSRPLVAVELLQRLLDERDVSLGLELDRDALHAERPQPRFDLLSQGQAGERRLAGRIRLARWSAARRGSRPPACAARRTSGGKSASSTARSGSMTAPGKLAAVGPADRRRKRERLR